MSSLAPEEQTIVRALPLLRGLDVSELEALEARMTKRALAPEEEVISEGDRNTALYVVLSGRLGVRLVEGRGDAKRPTGVKLAEIGTGALIGEYSIFDGRPASATVAAVVPSVVARLTRMDLEDVLRADAQTASRFYQNLVVTLIDRLREKDTELDAVLLS